jgi:hypothetical protein
MSLHPTAQIFKKQLENYVEGRSKGYIKDIGERRWDSRFYSEFMPLVFCIIFYILIYRYSKKNFIFHCYFFITSIILLLLCLSNFVFFHHYFYYAY